MDYKTAQQLKDAGFPQEIKAGDIVFWNKELWIHTGGGHNGEEGLYFKKGQLCCKPEDDVMVSSYLRNILDKEVLLIPTVPELIEACGDGFINLNRHKDRKGVWYRVFGIKNKEIITTMGKTSLEAVAKLYIELNKKK